jgi:hypothetical protein
MWVIKRNSGVYIKKIEKTLSGKSSKLGSRSENIVKHTV